MPVIHEVHVTYESGSCGFSTDRNNKNIRENPAYYKRRQSICEHPFGTIKRQWGYTYTLMKGPGKVDGEINLIGLVYNIKRTLSILGFEKLMKAFTNWKPDYARIIFSFLQHQFNVIWRRMVKSFFFSKKTIALI